MDKTRILIVEDEAIVAEDLAQKLSRLDYEVLAVVARGEESVARARARRPDLVLMDIRLEGKMDGVEAAGLIRRECDVPVIYLTAHSDSATLQRAKLTEPFGYILKPFEELELETQIQIALYKHRAEQQVRQEREWLQVTLRSIGDAVITGDAAGRVTSLNPVAEALTGWKLAEALSRPVEEVFRILDEESREPAPSPVERVLNEGKAIGLANHTVLIARDGSERAIDDTAAPIADARGRILGVVIVFHDVTERRRAEGALRRAKQEWERTFDSVPDLIAVLDAQRRFVRVNQAMARRLGVTPDQAVGMTGFEGVGQMVESLAACRPAPTGQGEREPIAEVHDDQLGGDFLVSATPLLDEAGQRTGAVLVARDVTRRKELEAQFLQAQKMDAIGQLAGGIAHDFNNILAAMILNLSMLKQTPGLLEGTVASLEELEQGAQRAANLTRQLLLFSRRQAMQIKVVDFNHVVREMLAMLQRLLGEHIDINFTARKEPLWVRADAVMLQQVLMNLCVNARDAMPEGGRLTLDTQSVAATEAMSRRPAGSQAAEFACLSVTDTGQGMDEATVKKVFEPFFTTKEVGKGTGLGLATVQGIVSQHQGWVEVDSALGRGTTFRVYVPQVAAAGTEDSSIPGRRDSRGGETILVVEDDDSLRRMAGKALRHFGYNVLEARTGVDALKVWENHGQKVNLVLTDMVMPEGMTGLELARRLRQLRPDLKVVIVSGYSEDLLRQGGQTPAGIKTLAKPFDPRTLAQTVRECLDGA